MKRSHKVLSWIGAVLVTGVATLGIALSHDAPCDAPQALTADTVRMKAIVYRCYGSPEVLSFEDVVKPALEADRVLIKVQAASVNPLDWHYMRGLPYIMRMSSGFGAPGIDGVASAFFLRSPASAPFHQRA